VSMEAGPLFRAEGLCKRFGAITALQGVDLSLAGGEICGLIGPNGSGKTTLFDCCTGLLRAEEGRVYLASEEVTGWPSHRISRVAGMVRSFQRVSVFGSMTVEEHLLAAGQARALAAGFRKIVGGNDLLPRALAASLDVRLSRPVRRIDWTTDTVAVETDAETFRGDVCVVAVPGPLTLEVGFDPPLPVDKVKAHLALQYSTASRIAVQYAEGDVLRRILGSGCLTDGMPASIHDQSMHLPGDAIALSGIAGGDAEPSLQTAAELLARVDAILSAVAGRPLTRLFGLVKSWTQDPWSRCVVRAPLGDQRSTILLAIAAPLERRIFFAGEHTDGRIASGGMEGAVRSAFRACGEVLGA
jgi:monoamine oxidase